MNPHLEKLLPIVTSISRLEGPKDLSPGPKTNALFHEFISTLRKIPSEQTPIILCNPSIRKLIPFLMKNCGEAEYLLENWFAEQVLNFGKKISHFPYYENYLELLAFEMKSLKDFLSSETLEMIRKVVVIGSGPLPLTSLLLGTCHLPWATFLNVDHDENAVRKGREVLLFNQNNNGNENAFRFLKCTAMKITPSILEDCDVIYLAALVGNGEKEKGDIINHLYKVTKPGTILMARSAVGLNTLIYHKIREKDVGKFEGFQHFEPRNQFVLNSIAIAKKMA